VGSVLSARTGTVSRPARGIELDWVLYSDYDALVEAFVRCEIDLAWNAPLAYVKIKRRLQDPCSTPKQYAD
jgi:ABC-type phosphate/phosphonate transport system substrate-binding protein